MGKSPLVVGSVVRAAAGTVFVHCEPWLTNQRMLFVGVAEPSRGQRDDAKDGCLIRIRLGGEQVESSMPVVTHRGNDSARIWF